MLVEVLPLEKVVLPDSSKPDSDIVGVVHTDCGV